MEDIRKLYDLYSKDIYKFVISLTLNHEASEDIMQNTFVSAIKSLKTFKGNSSVKTWLLGIAKNEYYTYIRKNPMSIQLDEIGEISYNQDKRETYMSMMEEIQKLQEPQKQIVILRLINELTFKEIGSIIDKSENYCRVSFFREKQKLWEVLKSE